MKNNLSNKLFFTLLLAGALISIFFRVYDLTMDPYPASISGAAWSDEGQYVINARNMILFNQWEIENNYLNTMYMSPVHNYLAYLSFKSFGLSTFSLRLIPAVLGLISVFFASFMLFTKNKKAGLAYFILLISNLVLIANSRLATLEYLIISLIIIIIGLIIYNKPISWIFAGILAPFLFFSKIISVFFIISIPVSLLAYYIIYRKKKDLINFACFLIGFIISAALWIILWLIPNFDSWIFINFRLFSYRIPLSLSKLVGMALFQFNLLALLGTVIILFFILALVYYIFKIVKNHRINHLELFLLICLILFQFQTIFTDFPMRRLVTLIPIILLIATLFITKIKEMDIKINGHKYILNQNYLLILIIAMYLIFNLAPLALFFGTGFLHPEQSHTFLRSSQEMNKHIPEGSKVYGLSANSLGLENTNIKTYYPIQIYVPELEEKMFNMLTNKEINYIILRENLFEYNAEHDRETSEKFREYITQNFKLLKVLDGDDYYYGKEHGQYMYIYERIRENSEAN